jgi:hypothetical protein
MVYERTKSISEFVQLTHEMRVLVEQNPDIVKFLCTKEHYAQNDMCWGVSQTTSFERSLLILSMRYKKVEIVTNDMMEEFKRCCYLYYVFSVPVPNSSVKYIHVITDKGVYMYRGGVKLYT